jgi:site-specific recombinase XerD
MLRKTFATRLLKKGCPLTSIQKYLGHNDIKMTMIYLDIDIQMLDSDYNNYYPY